MSFEILIHFNKELEVLTRPLRVEQHVQVGIPAHDELLPDSLILLISFKDYNFGLFMIVIFVILNKCFACFLVTYIFSRPPELSCAWIGKKTNVGNVPDKLNFDHFCKI